MNDPTTASEEMYVEQELLLARLPARIAEAARAAGRAGLIEVVLDLGRIPTARYSGGREIALTESEVSEQDIDQVVSQVSEFGEDNRAGIPRTLHRISAIRNRRGRIVGLTCRIGRSVSGSASVNLPKSKVSVCFENHRFSDVSSGPVSSQLPSSIRLPKTAPVCHRWSGGVNTNYE